MGVHNKFFDLIEKEEALTREFDTLLVTEPGNMAVEFLEWLQEKHISELSLDFDRTIRLTHLIAALVNKNQQLQRALDCAPPRRLVVQKNQPIYGPLPSVRWLILNYCKALEQAWMLYKERI